MISLEKKQLKADEIHSRKMSLPQLRHMDDVIRVTKVYGKLNLINKVQEINSNKNIEANISTYNKF